MHAEHPRAAVAACGSHLSSYGLTLDGLDTFDDAGQADLVLRLLDRRPLQIQGQYFPRVSSEAALRRSYAVQPRPLMLFADQIHGRTADTLRDAGIWFIDTAGNAFLQVDGLLIDVRGRRLEPATASIRSVPEPTKPSANLFSAVRAQVICAVLTEPDLLNSTYRDLATHSGASLGTAKSTVDTLVDSGFVDRQKWNVRLVHGQDLLHLWSRAYATGLGRTSELIRLDGDPLEWTAVPGLDWVISGEQAVTDSIRNPQTLCLYVGGLKRTLPTDLIVQNRWRKSTTGPIRIARKFWNKLPGLYGPRTAPFPIVYADLLTSQESRQIEAARELLETDVRLRTV